MRMKLGVHKSHLRAGVRIILNGKRFRHHFLSAKSSASARAESVQSDRCWRDLASVSDASARRRTGVFFDFAAIEESEPYVQYGLAWASRKSELSARSASESSRSSRVEVEADACKHINSDVRNARNSHFLSGGSGRTLHRKQTLLLLQLLRMFVAGLSDRAFS